MSYNDNGVFYYTTGINSSNERLAETWKYAVATSVESTISAAGIKLSPNPVQSFLRVEVLEDFIAPILLTAYAVNGKRFGKDLLLEMKRRFRSVNFRRVCIFWRSGTEMTEG